MRVDALHGFGIAVTGNAPSDQADTVWHSHCKPSTSAMDDSSRARCHEISGAVFTWVLSTLTFYRRIVPHDDSHMTPEYHQHHPDVLVHRMMKDKAAFPHELSYSL